MQKQLLFFILTMVFGWLPAIAQQPDTSAAVYSDNDVFFIKKIYQKALTQGRCYDYLRDLTRLGGRLSGSPQAAAAVELTRQMLDTLGLDTVWLQPCKVPHWVRGDQEVARIVESPTVGTVSLRTLVLGHSVATPPIGLTANVIEVKSLKEVELLGRAKVQGKIVFFNRPMDATQVSTFSAYGGAVDQRVYGAGAAANYGAVAVVVRSMTTRHDDIPHTGVMSYGNLASGVQPIPAFAISTNDANMLSRLLEKEKDTRLHLWSNCQMLSEKISYNVIGELKGTKFPDEIILVGGHLDSWDVGAGAHDDGAGCVQAMDVLQLFKRLGYRPQRTVRCVLFMNEESGLAGGTAYAKASDENSEFHLAAIESDRGGFTPRGFSAEGHEATFSALFKKMTRWQSLFLPYDLRLERGGSGADISGLRGQKGLLIGFLPDSQRYFDYHHTPIDTFDAVNQRELELGTAAITALVYLIDQYGL